MPYRTQLKKAGANFKRDGIKYGLEQIVFIIIYQHLIVAVSYHSSREKIFIYSFNQINQHQLDRTNLLIIKIFPVHNTEKNHIC